MLSCKPKTKFNSFSLNHTTAYVFWATANDSPPIPNINRPTYINQTLSKVAPTKYNFSVLWQHSLAYYLVINVIAKIAYNHILNWFFKFLNILFALKVQATQIMEKIQFNYFNFYIYLFVVFTIPIYFYL